MGGEWSVIGLARRTIRHRKGAFVAALAAILISSALVTACGVLLETGIRGSVAPELYAAAPILVTDKQQYTPPPPEAGGRVKAIDLPGPVPLDPSVADRIKAVAGVGSVVAETRFPVVAVKDGRLLATTAASWGHAWPVTALAPLRLTDGREPAGPREVVVDAATAARGGLRPGDAVGVRDHAGTTEQFQVAGIVTGDLRQQNALFFTSDEASRLAGQGGKADLFAVSPAGGVDPEELAGRIADEVSVRAVTGPARGSLEFPGADTGTRLIPLAAVFGGLSLMIAMIVVVGTFALSLNQRRREIGLLRVIGARASRIRRMVAGEAVLISATASLIGVGFGFLVARIMFAGLRSLSVVPEYLQLRSGPLPAVVAFGVCVLVPVLTVLLVAHSTTRASPIEALSAAAVEPRRVGWLRLSAGVVCAGLGVVVAVALARLRPDQTFQLTIALLMITIMTGVLLTPYFGRIVTGLSGRLITRFGGSARLAVTNSRRNNARLAAACVPLMMTAGVLLSMIFMQTTNVDSTARKAAGVITADEVLVSSAGGMPLAAADDARKLPGVQTVTVITRTSIVTDYLDGPHRRRSKVWDARAVSAAGLNSTFHLPISSGTIDGSLPADGIALSDKHAAVIGRGVGDQVTLRLGDGTPVTFTVCAVYHQVSGLGDAVFPRDALEGHLASGSGDQLLVRAGPATDAGQLAAAVNGLATRWPGVHPESKSVVYDAVVKRAQSQAWTNYLLAAVIGLYTVIAAVNTLVMATANRTREFALLRLAGGHLRVLHRMARWESLIIFLVSATLATICAGWSLVPLSIALSGSPIPAVRPATYLAVVLGIGLLGWATVELTTRFCLRRPLMESIGSRE
ncbi:FtsX-like permease family protein [Actinoplanes sp. HUAS TT8]|uniref:FtsX-like permease family protein n=1 Tax=Actinoplanes sp. HUAS TT8 TaxID=3447453 RepID=UPI003F5247EF